MKKKEKLKLNEALTTLVDFTINKLDEKKYSKYRIRKLTNAIEDLDNHLQSLEVEK